MISVGITGSYASGKTFILDYLSNKGFKTFSADICVKELYKDAAIQQQILNLLPKLRAFEREKIINLIYDNDEARLKLQNFIHPFVIRELLAFQQHNLSFNFTFAEIPLLFEAGFRKYFDFVVTIFCSEETRINRAKSRGFFNPVIYKKIEKIQLPQHTKIEKSDFSINADVNMIELEKQINQLIKQLKCKNPRK